MAPLKVVICRNRRGKFAKGRKVTSIDFITVNIAMITSNDSRIRFIDARVTLLYSYSLEWKADIQDQGTQKRELPYQGKHFR
jgi:hypothetical protein